MTDPYVGQEVAGQFRIVQRIGTGGMGAVYKAEQPEMNRFVAVKILHPRYLSRADVTSRFRREARAMSQLSHPNTARVFMYGQFDDGAAYFVMEHLEGRNLAQAVRAEGPFEPVRALQVMIQVCGALQEAHLAGIIHRDLKPENIFLTKQGGIEDFPKVLDFGLAKVTEKQLRPGSVMVTQQGAVFGTPEFMSPEQCRGATLDARSDIYSIGIVLFELLTGQLPFEAKQPLDFIDRHINGTPLTLAARAPARRFAPGLEDVLRKTLAKRPEDRYASAAELAVALHRCLEEPLANSGLHALPASSRPPADPAAIPVVSPPGAAPVAPAGPVAEPAPTLPTHLLPWLVLGAGVVLAMGGVVALAVAYFML